MSEGYQEPFKIYRARPNASGQVEPSPDSLLSTSRVSFSTLGTQAIVSRAELAEQQAKQPLTQEERELALDDWRNAIMNNLGGEETNE